jgi:flagellar biogenesis protein FliO
MQAASRQRRISEAVSWLRAACRQWRLRPPRKLRLCETLALGERRFVAVVEFEQQRFLIGGTGTAVALLANLPPAAPAERARPEPE